MPADLNTFFEMYAKPSSRGYVNRDSYELKYAAAALMIACAKADFEEDPDEEEVIIEILRKTFNVSGHTLDSLIRMADSAASNRGLEDFARLVNENYSDKGKFFLIFNLWRVAYADGRLDQYEENFINRISSMIRLDEEKVLKAQRLANPETVAS